MKVRALLATAVLVGAVAGTVPIAQLVQPPSDIDDGRRWFESPPTLTSASPPLLRASRAAAFNQRDAEALLLRIIRSAPASEQASQAHELLSRIYLRTGQYTRLIANLDEWARKFQGRAEVSRERADVEQFRGLPDQANGERRRSTLHHDPSSFFIPVSVNGRPASYLFDTGAWVSVITESEATRLGLEIRNAAGVVAGSSGQAVRSRYAVVRDLVVGSMRFRNVSFLVLSNGGPIGEPTGIIGIPVLLGVGAIHWINEGPVELGLGATRSLARNAPNLVFFQNHLLLRAVVRRRGIFATLDTGAESSDLNANFQLEFADFVEQTGAKTTQPITGAAGTASFDAIRLPEVIFTIGGTDAVLRPAMLSMQRIPSMGGDCCVANVGKDILSRGGGFTIDFSAMTLSVDAGGSQ